MYVVSMITHQRVIFLQVAVAVACFSLCLTGCCISFQLFALWKGVADGWRAVIYPIEDGAKSSVASFFLPFLVPSLTRSVAPMGHVSLNFWKCTRFKGEITLQVSNTSFLHCNNTLWITFEKRKQ